VVRTRVLRVLVIVMLAALFSPATLGWTPSVPADECSDRPGDGCPEENGCPGEGSDGTCPPDCHVCACCGHAAGTLVRVAAVAALEEREPGLLLGDGPSASADPQDILHVPRRTLA